jgi:hypothetical protein
MQAFSAILIFCTYISFAQEVSTITSLSTTIDETSGLIYLDGKIITHNDSGNEALLHEIDTINGEVLRTVVITNALNTDWEDITFDENYIYIGDFGNNAGTRTDLKIYRITISDYFTSDSVNADIINFSYADQTNFSSQIYTHNFDAEALINRGDSLYLFTKNWLDAKSNVYSLSKTPGTYTTNKIDQLETDGLITGADFNPISNKLILSGYSFTNPFIVQLSQFENDLFSSGTLNKIVLNVDESIQVEAICAQEGNQYFLSSEAHSSGASSLYKLDTQDLAVDSFQLQEPNLSPNPAGDYLQIKGADIHDIYIYNSSGTLVLHSNKNQINTSMLKSGLHIVKVKYSNGKTSHQRLIIE